MITKSSTHTNKKKDFLRWEETCSSLGHSADGAGGRKLLKESSFFSSIEEVKAASTWGTPVTEGFPDKSDGWRGSNWVVEVLKGRASGVLPSAFPTKFNRSKTMKIPYQNLQKYLTQICKTVYKALLNFDTIFLTKS